MHITRLPVQRSRLPTRRSGRTHTIDGGRSLEDGKGVERTTQGSSANYRRIRRQARANQEASSARTLSAAWRAHESRGIKCACRFSTWHAGHGKRDREQAPVPSYFLQPSPPNDPGRVKTREIGMERALETTKVSTPDIGASRRIWPSTRPGSFLETSWASTDNAATTPPDLPPYHTSVWPLNQPKTARRAECKGTRNHHQATKTGRLEATPVRRPRVGQRSMLLSTPTLTPVHVPWVSPWSYKREDPGISRGHTQHFTDTR